ncbi:MAG: glutamyl-tRNA reductase [bacterium]|nr:glutamyl-tRNA reductase [bacterium]
MSTEVAPEEPQIFIAGVSYKSTPVELREKFSVADSAHSSVINDLCMLEGICEAAVISTCNRVELLVVVDGDKDPSAVKSMLVAFFERMSNEPSERFSSGFYLFAGREAVSHLFRVSCGLDSMVVGEPQILGQVKNAYRRAREACSAGPLINGLFHRAFRAAKNVRSSTGIGKNAVSVCYAARELAEHIFGDLSEASVMLLGAGETGELALKHFLKSGVRKIFVCNRSVSKALMLAERYGAVALSVAQLPEFLAEADIIIGAIALPSGSEPLVNALMTRSSQGVRRNEPQFFIDLAVPRNFSPDLSVVEDVFLYNIDHLEEIVAKNMSGRLGEIDKASSMLEDYVEEFFSWRQVRALDPEIVRIRQSCMEQADREMLRTLKFLRRQGIDQDILQSISVQLQHNNSALVSRFLHPVLSLLKEEGVHNPELVKVARKMVLAGGRSETFSDIAADVARVKAGKNYE